jgi:hypothetical protein
MQRMDWTPKALPMQKLANIKKQNPWQETQKKQRRSSNLLSFFYTQNSSKINWSFSFPNCFWNLFKMQKRRSSNFVERRRNPKFVELFLYSICFQIIINEPSFFCN